MKAIRTVQRVMKDRDGFLNGFVKGVAGSALFVSMLSMFTGCLG